MNSLQAITRPYVILKWAQTSDGFIARRDFSSKWISGEASRELVHHWRAKVSAVLVGARTLLHDNPALTARPGGTLLPFEQQPLRIALLNRGLIPSGFKVLDNSAPTLVITALDNPLHPATISAGATQTETLVFNTTYPEQTLNILNNHKVRSVLIEGGAQTLQAFIDVELWDEVHIFQSPQRFESGIPAPTFKILPFSGARTEITEVRSQRIESDILVSYKRRGATDAAAQLNFQCTLEDN